MKLRCTNKKLAGQTIHFPIIGDTKIDSDCVIEIDEDKAEAFLKVQCGTTFRSLDEVEEPNEKAVPTVSERELYRAELEKLKKEEIRALIDTHPSSETEELKSTKSRIDFLVNKQFN